MTFSWKARILSLVCCVMATGCMIDHGELALNYMRRSILDGQPRMITLSYDDHYYLSYDLARPSLRKFWRGGVLWNGAAFNNIKTIQPESWGHFLHVSDEQEDWTISKGPDNIRLHPNFIYYEIESSGIHFKYGLVDSVHQVAEIIEAPRLHTDGSFVYLTRNITLAQNAGLEIFWHGQKVKSGINVLRDTFAVVTTPEPPHKSISGNNSQHWLERSGCMTCHETNTKTVGPSLQQIANKYPRGDSTVRYLTARVKEGGAGVWGEVPMIPHPHLADKDIQGMIRYILSLRTEEYEDLPSDVGESTSEMHLAEVKPGFGHPLEAVHPSFDLIEVRPSGFTPRVGGMDFTENGDLLICTWDSLGAVYRLRNIGGDTSDVDILEIASGLAEPLGLKVVGEKIYVAQKNEITELVDLDGDEIIDRYVAICNDFQVSADFHEYTYGLEAKDGFLYATLGVAMRLMQHELQLPDRGTLIKIAPDGSFERLIDGLRQPNGIGIGPDGQLFITENQGRWVPSCKFIHAVEGDFHGFLGGSGDRFMGRKMASPSLWLPQNDIANSPGQPILVSEGIYTGQMLFGEVTHGGVKRVFLEKVNGNYQGCVFRFTQGLEAGINRLAWGSDGGLYVGGVGMVGNWSHRGKQFGLQKLAYNDSPTFELLRVQATPDGFWLEFTTPLKGIQADEFLDKIKVERFYYEPTANYGGPKIDVTPIEIKSIAIGKTRRKLRLELDGLEEKHIYYFKLSPDLRDDEDRPLWAGDAWYTLNEIPKKDSLSL